jgi:hypothetical protein
LQGRREEDREEHGSASQRQATRHARSGARGAVARPSATSACAFPETVSALELGFRASVTRIPAGHHVGKRSSVVSLGMTSDAQSRPPGALGCSVAGEGGR